MKCLLPVYMRFLVVLSSYTLHTASGWFHIHGYKLEQSGDSQLFDGNEVIVCSSLTGHLRVRVFLDSIVSMRFLFRREVKDMNLTII